MKKYIVKNCPAGIPDGDTQYCWDLGAEDDEPKCRDVSNCLIKRIIKRCTYQLNKIGEHQFLLGSKALAREVLSLFEIEETKAK